MANAIATQVQELYVGYLGRAAEQAGLNYWVNQISSGAATIESVAQGFTESNEYAAAYGDLDTAALVAQVYENVLGREGEAAGLAYWENMITSGTITADQLVNTMLNSLGSIDQATVNNKVYVASVYTLAAGANYNAEQGADILVGINETQDSVVAALAKVDIVVNVTPAALAEALTDLQEANQAKADFLDDGDDTTDLAAEEAAVGAALTTAQGDVKALVPAYDATAPENVNAAVISNAQAAYAKAVTDAQAAVTKVVGLNALINTYKSAVVANEAAQEAVAPAQVAVNSEIAKAQVLLGNDTLTLDATTGAVTGTTTGDVLVVENGKLVVDADLTGDAKAAATALLPTVQAYLNVNAAADKAETSLINAANAVETKEGLTADNNTALQAGKATALLDAQEDSSDLADALADLAEAQAAADSLDELNTAIQDAQEHLAVDLNAAVVELDSASATETAGAGNDVFLFTQDDDANLTVTIDNFGDSGQDYLFIGEGYTFNGDIEAGSNRALEVFFTQDGSDVVVSVESSEFGSNAATPELNNITLTGVNVDELSFENGFITVAA